MGVLAPLISTSQIFHLSYPSPLVQCWSDPFELPWGPEGKVKPRIAEARPRPNIDPGVRGSTSHFATKHVKESMRHAGPQGFQLIFHAPSRI